MFLVENVWNANSTQCHNTNKEDKQGRGRGHGAGEKDTSDC